MIQFLVLMTLTYDICNLASFYLLIKASSYFLQKNKSLSYTVELATLLLYISIAVV